jgi:hypothetical protein
MSKIKKLSSKPSHPPTGRAGRTSQTFLFPSGSTFWLKSEHILNKILTLTFSAARNAALPPTTKRSDGADRKGGTGKWNARSAFAFAVAEFRALQCGATPHLIKHGQ